MEMQILVRQRFPSRHGRKNVPDRTDERPSTDEHDDHRLYVNVLQVRERVFTLMLASKKKIGTDGLYRFIYIYINRGIELINICRTFHLTIESYRFIYICLFDSKCVTTGRYINMSEHQYAKKI